MAVQVAELASWIYRDLGEVRPAGRTMDHGVLGPVAWLAGRRRLGWRPPRPSSRPRALPGPLTGRLRPLAGRLWPRNWPTAVAQPGEC